MDVTEWLRSLGLERYASAFHDNGIDERVLPELTAEDLKDLGISMVGHRRMLLKAIAGLRAGPSAAADVSAPGPRLGGGAPAADGDVLRPGRIDGAGGAARSRRAARCDRCVPPLCGGGGSPL